jgi:hypothetical protein
VFANSESGATVERMRTSNSFVNRRRRLASLAFSDLPCDVYDW